MVNYDLKKIKALVFDVDGVLSMETIFTNTQGELLRSINTKDGYAIRLASMSGLHVAIISGGNEESIRLRYEKIGVEDIFLGSSVKTEKLGQLLEKYNLTADEVLYMGDDIPDYEVMKQVGLPCCPRDATPEVRDISIYVSHKDGGRGCVRDVIEQVLKAQGKWMADEKAFSW
ncbi:MAG: HAD-IIIA family hydrolase [Bacteroidaceae bacterium]|nr:HAD-IIIA family hydrolase [Bacteroidaceae bacterium]MBQ9294107.1 HAD-IIIA family hydrolase [Bacteroidaceae bacterium]